ncbi:hypothetical protein PVAP13_5KG049800 [Panicum virgatum]|uniref:Uncharacterized protein n=1 Tax=Panicum virgatum TaxID=38727 RepID=A0A8T0S7K3_PANVG|nr:hypothetical protein PVAP13_5KG049800 [Panicum virgatum]
MSPMRWKASHFMIATVTVWGGLVYAGFELFDPEERNKKTLAKAKALALAKSKAK